MLSADAHNRNYVPHMNNQCTLTNAVDLTELQKNKPPNMTSFLKGLHSLPFRHYSSSCLMFVGKSIKGPNKWLLCILHRHSLCSVQNFEGTPFSFVLHLYGWVSSL